MKRDELCETLRQKCDDDRKAGLVRVSDPRYRNIWFVVPPPPPSKVPKHMPVSAISKAMQTLEVLPHSNAMTPLDRLISFLFLRQEAVTSSRLEGTWSTIDQVLTPPELWTSYHSEERSNLAAVIGYAKALEMEYQTVNQQGIKAFDIPLVLRLHQMTLSRDPHFTGNAGQLRTPGKAGAIVQIGGLGRKENSTYNPAPPEYVKKCLSAVMAWHRDDLIVEMGDAGMGLPLPIRMALGHSHFEAVHPFPDGNGRVGRMLWPLQMTASGIMPIYLSGYVEAMREEYNQALQEAQKKLRYGRMVEFVCEALVTSSKKAHLTRKALEKLPGIWRKRGKFRKHSSSERSLPHLLETPIITVPRLAKKLGVSFNAANTALSQLSAKKIVRERTGHKRYRLFAAEEVLSLLVDRSY